MYIHNIVNQNRRDSHHHIKKSYHCVYSQTIKHSRQWNLYHLQLLKNINTISHTNFESTNCYVLITQISSFSLQQNNTFGAAIDWDFSLPVGRTNHKHLCWSILHKNTVFLRWYIYINIFISHFCELVLKIAAAHAQQQSPRLQFFHNQHFKIGTAQNLSRVGTRVLVTQSVARRKCDFSASEIWW